MSENDLQQSFRLAMRSLHSTVSVVTTAVEGARYNITVTSVTSVSMDPPSLLVCINRAAEAYAGLGVASHFCVNMLSSGQQPVAAHCATHLLGEERFAEGDWYQGASELPVLKGACASLCCRIDFRQSYGSHDIFVGLVESVSVEDADRTPLLYGAGSYLT